MVREYDIDPVTGERQGAEFVAFHEHPVSCPNGVNREGLEEAATEVARWIQAELLGYGDEPLPRRDALDLWMLRLRYVNALDWLDASWKDVEACASPDGVPRSICMGSGREVSVQVMHFGRPMVHTMHGYRGCLRTFPVKPHGRGRPWATWCPECRPRKSNYREKAKSEYQRRIAEIGR
jgi:hypothetical protein